MKETVVVIGLGTMGHGIAQTFATFGQAVHCYDRCQGSSSIGFKLHPIKKLLHCEEH